MKKVMKRSELNFEIILGKLRRNFDKFLSEYIFFFHKFLKIEHFIS